MNLSITAQIAELLLDLYSDVEQLHRFVRIHYPVQAPDILIDKSPRAIAYRIVDILAPQRLIDDAFFARLREERPKRGPDIDAVATDWRARPPVAFARQRRLDLRTAPPRPFVEIRVKPWDSATTPQTAEIILQGTTDAEGRCSVGWSLDIEKVGLELDWRLHGHPDQASLRLGPFQLREGERQVVDLSLPEGRLSLLHRTIAGARRHARWTAMCGLTAFVGAAVVVLSVEHWASPPKGTMYVAAIPYTTGLRDNSGEESFASRVLAVVARETHRWDLTFQLEAAFSNPPKEPTKIETFYIEHHEVTVARYKEYLDHLTGEPRKAATPGLWQQQADMDRQRGGPETTRLYMPVHSVSWDQALKFCEAHQGTLPTSSQWEIAARHLVPEAEDKYGYLYPWGNDWNPDANTEETRFTGLMPACGTGDKTPAENGWARQLCDMGGNLHEWTLDPAGPPSPTGEPTKRWLRGASYNSDGVILAMNYVEYVERAPDDQDPSLGFRCVYPDRKAIPEGTNGTPHLVEIPGGIYHNLGWPNDPRLKLLARAGAYAEHILAPPIRHPSVGDLFVQQHKVTNAEYQQFLRDTGGGHGPWSIEHRIPATYDHSVQSAGKPDEPVSGVSWFDAFSYCASIGMRLPSVVEWERIVRGAEDSLFPWGDDASAGAGFFDAPAPSASHALVRDMWSIGPEWTLDEGSRRVEGETRALKGLVSGSNLAIHSRDAFEQFLTTVQRPESLEEKPRNATVRCVVERRPTRLERWFGWAPPSRIAAVHQWPPTPSV